MEQRCNKMLPLYTENHGFYTDNYKDVSDIHYHLRTNNHIKRQFVLNQVVGHLKKEEMLPAICFVYSRKNVERFAKELTHSLNDSMKMTQVEKNVGQSLRGFKCEGVYGIAGIQNHCGFAGKGNWNSSLRSFACFPRND